MRRAGLILLSALVAGTLAACGDDDDEDATTAPTDSITIQTDPIETSTAPSSENPSGETADLPLCSAAPPPCRTASGELVEP